MRHVPLRLPHSCGWRMDLRLQRTTVTTGITAAHPPAPVKRGAAAARKAAGAVVVDRGFLAKIGIEAAKRCMTSDPSDLKFEVYRLQAEVRHDRRGLELRPGQLLVFEKNSTSQVKCRDRIHLTSDTILEMSFTAEELRTGQVKQKDYIFEFASPAEADIFCEESYPRFGTKAFDELYRLKDVASSHAEK
eukprot:g31235.t1